ncbi:glycosyltransferase [bacterium]|nr:glycosyltransferase [bacterium]
MSKPLVSIITVVRNRELVIERCIRSILSQSYKNFEYLIKDGNSTDKTVEIISRFTNRLAYFETSPDKNLYDAMNIATQHATGEWVCYIQSDDMLFAENVLEQVAPHLKKTTADVVYGTALLEFEWGVTKTLLANPVNTMWNHMPFCHQAMFLRTKVAKQYPFDLSLLPAADYDQVYKLYSLGYKFEVMPVMVSKLSAGGMSDTKRILGLKQVGKIKQKYDKNMLHHLLHSVYVLKSDINLRIRNILPKSIVKKIFQLREIITEK